VVRSQQGRTKSALEHLELAIKSDPNYADAHFNLAVIHATSGPPNIPAARAAYQRARSLGVGADSALETLIK
jgi:Tfp pilus assembly protein PilF